MTSKVKVGDLHQETKSKKVVKGKCAVCGSQRKRDWPKWDLACVGLSLSRTGLSRTGLTRLGKPFGLIRPGLRRSWPSSASFNKVCFRSPQRSSYIPLIKCLIVWRSHPISHRLPRNHSSPFTLNAWKNLQYFSPLPCEIKLVWSKQAIFQLLSIDFLAFTVVQLLHHS